MQVAKRLWTNGKLALIGLRLLILLAIIIGLIGFGRFIESRYLPAISASSLTFGSLQPPNYSPTPTPPTWGASYRGMSSELTKHFWWNFVLTHTPGKKEVLQLIVDDCVNRILINGHDADLRGIPLWMRCDLSRGFTFDFTPYLSPGPNDVSILIIDNGGMYTASYVPHILGGIGVDQAVLLGWMVLMLALWQRLVLVPRAIRTSPAGRDFRIVFCVAALLYCFRFLVSVPTENVHDYPDHLRYILYVAQHFWRPNLYFCVECYQPPIYYIFAACFYHIGVALGLIDPSNALKVLGLAIYLGLGAVVLRLILRLRMRHGNTLLGYALFLLWPLGFVKSTDINNDILVATCILASLYYTLRWYRRITIGNAFIALGAAAIAMLVKSTGMIAFVIFGVAALMALSRKRVTLGGLLSPRYLLVFALTGFIGISNILYLHWSVPANDNRSLVVFNAIGAGNTVQYFHDDKPSYYLSFPYETFLNYPFINPYDDITGRKYFWNNVLKTSLYGEWSWQAPIIALLMNITYLLMIVYACAVPARRFFAYKTAAISDQSTLYVVLMALLPAMLMAFRISQPASPNQDARYIYAAIPLFCMLYAHAVESCWRQGNPRAGWVGVMLGLLFMALSVAFFFVQYVPRLLG